MVTPLYKNEYGEIQPVQERALEELGIELPKPDEPKGRKNNRKMTFDRQIGTVRSLYGHQLHMPKLTRDKIRKELLPLLTYYAERDRGIITDRVCETILIRQRV